MHQIEVPERYEKIQKVRIMNIGEKSERFLKAFLLKRRDENITDTVFGKITELSDDTDLSQLSWTKNADSFLSSYDVPNLVKILGIGKAQTGSKADISVNKIKYSLKEINGGPPAIVNHTPRPGFEKVCNRIGVSITKLDKIISDYWSLRQKGIIKQDTKISDKNCPFKLHKKYFL